MPFLTLEIKKYEIRFVSIINCPTTKKTYAYHPIKKRNKAGKKSVFAIFESKEK